MRTATLMAAVAAIVTVGFATNGMSAQKKGLPVCNDLQIYNTGACTCAPLRTYQKISATKFRCMPKNK